MKCYCLMVLACLAAVAAAEEYYSGKLDNVDTHRVINNDRLLEKYKKCILNKAETGCPQDALELKKVFQEALETTCAKCSPQQQEKIKDTLGYLCKKKRHVFDEILAKIDPDQKYRAAFEAKFGKLEGCPST
ncbi:ejaculatory bulb-specific protein 3-like isoform X1 [Neodiprion fabricii]|uniref:ejaculatory bulb-specific protein 3-like isoform X1 n=1 Tax=Neodiprion fabricii TaxID=2872261 RepID=UPI001ED8F423|nr:ejaculatory bulb-specific protein 3-like isoform X1 [Neodiprion fabricii]